MGRNEQAVCERIVTLLEERSGHRRADVRCPEKTGEGPPIDLRLTMGGREFAIEHTRIEAFRHQIRTDALYVELIRLVIEALSDELPGAALYELRFPLDVSLGSKNAKVQALRNELVEWVRRSARQVHELNADTLRSSRATSKFVGVVQGRPEGFRYEVQLWVRAALSEAERGTLSHGRYAPEDNVLETAREARLRQALDDKCPKLQQCREQGARTVLVLESDDIALTNHVVVGHALASALKERTDVPDEIYFVETGCEPWSVHAMKQDDECWPFEFGPSTR